MKKSLDRCIMRSFSSLPLAVRPRLILNDEDISRICDYLCLDFGDFKIRHKHEDNRYFVIIPKKRNVKVPENQRLGDVAIDPGVRTFGVDVDRDYNGARGIYLRALSAMTPPKAGNC